MAMKSSEIEQMIKEAIPDAEIIIEDLRGDGDHYSARVISRVFEGKTRVQQHQIVYGALKGKMGGQLHALALTTEAPANT
ncbi:MAG: BolA family transcriptional regulator [Magnetovibrio sp.]|nr:BolA family transcriptional regulator [Magnetovibrio sp.]|tara:strand:+ start:37 stop:276 length:240 start_codon:yes stop_codon:yes gene_type:complete